MSKRPMHARFEELIVSLYNSLKYQVLFHREKKKFGNFYFPYSPLHKGEEAFILANGPSLKDELDSSLMKDVQIGMTLVVNFFAETELFTVIKPKYYCLADPAFNIQNRLNEKTRRVYDMLNEKVDWPLTLFVWKEADEMVHGFISNPMIKIVSLSTLLFRGFESKRFEYYKKGEAVPSYVNVTIMALYTLLNLGYSKIFLYGVDHSFLAGLCVNDANRLCLLDKHFYGTEKCEFQPKEDGTLWTMKDFIYDKYLTFVEHEVMRGYADYLGAKIINCTKDSWIDAYTRIAQIEKK